MKTIKENCILFSLLFYCVVLLKDAIPTLVFVSCILIWKLRTKDKSFLLLILLFSITYIPKYSIEYPTITQGKVVVSTNTYAILQNKNEKVMVYVDEMLPFDAVYELGGKFSKITTTEGFYNFDQKNWLKQLGVTYSFCQENLRFVKNGNSIRFYLQEKIRKIEDEGTRKQLLKVLFNVKEKEDTSYFFEHGFSYAAMLYVLDYVLKYIFTKKTRDRILLFCNVILMFIYQAPMLLVQAFIFRFLRQTKLDSKQQFSIGMTLMFLIYGNSCTSMSFLIPYFYRISRIFKEKSFILLMMLWMQSYYLHQVNLLQTILYPFMILLVGFAWILGIVRLWITWIPFTSYCLIFDAIGLILMKTNIYSSLVGLGFPFYLLLCYSFIHSKYCMKIAIGLFLIFSYTGLFHPFAEVTIINVGQGDSILIREPFNRNNVLIDTGKPTQWNTLQTFLHSKGINQIDTLFITHSDNDHSGNQQNVINTFQVEQLVTEHQDVTTCNMLLFYDLNAIKNEDENQSSLALYTKLNGLTYLFMGDCDVTSEESIIRKYPSIKCDMLKLGHHGSKTSSSDDFLDTVQPRYGLISSGAYKIYHHPSPTTIQKLLARHIPYYDTKEEGDISIISLPYCNLFVTSSGKIGIIPIL